MATFLDVGLLEPFKIIFPFIFIIVIFFVGLTRFAWFKERPFWAGILGFAVAAMALTSNIVTKTINLAAPWFVLLFVMIIFILLAYGTFGVEEKGILEYVTKSDRASTIGWWVLSLSLIIALGSLSTVVSEEVGFTKLSQPENYTTATGQVVPVPIEEKFGFFATITHPRVLGLALLFLIAMFAIGRLSSVPRK